MTLKAYSKTIITALFVAVGGGILGWGVWVTHMSFAADETKRKLDKQCDIIHSRITKSEDGREDAVRRLMERIDKTKEGRETAVKQLMNKMDANQQKILELLLEMQRQLPRGP